MGAIVIGRLERDSIRQMTKTRRMRESVEIWYKLSWNLIVEVVLSKYK